MLASDGRPVAEVRHLHTDHLGIPRELTVTDGHIAWAAEYRAWGNALIAIDERLSPTSHDATVGLASSQPIRFQGQYCDSETGLHYNRFRYYDSDIGTFVSTDPIGLAGGANGYRYAPNPTGWADPLGLAPCNNGGDAVENKNTSAKLPSATQTITNPPQAPVIPPHWESRPGKNGGEIFFPPGTNPAAGEHIRVMPPGSSPIPGYEHGYWRWVNNNKQPMNPATGKPGKGQGDTHVPLPPDSIPPPRR